MNINSEIARIFGNIGNMLDIAGENPFKVRAYKNASRNIMALEEDLRAYSENNEIENIKGIGKDLAKKIREYIDKGKIQYYEDLKTEVPEDLLALLSIQGIGPKLLGILYKDFEVKNFRDLENIIGREELKETKGIGTKKINEIKVGIKLFKSHLDKINLGFALPVAESVKKELSALDSVDGVEISGDIRRGVETVRSIELVVSTSGIDSVKKSVKSLPFIDKAVKEDKESLSLILENGIPLSLQFAGRDEFTGSLFIGTGSQKHIKKIKQLARGKGVEIGKDDFPSEDQLYETLKMQYIPAEVREGKGEIESSLEFNIPKLLEIGDIRGDLHTHSTWSDGRSGIKDMAEAARDLGYEYIAITDHSVSSRIANGLDVKRVIEKNIELQKIDKKTGGIKIIMGSEVDIKPDGTLDYPDDVLRELDMVVASVHSNFKMNRGEMTERITNALKNPYVCALGHPTGRLIGERNPYDLDIDEVIGTAEKHGKALEVNSSYMRLDLKDEHVRKALDKGVKLIISTDAHHTDQLAQMRYGVLTARRGWATKRDVINTLKLKDIENWIRNFK